MKRIWKQKKKLEKKIKNNNWFDEKSPERKASGDLFIGELLVENMSIKEREYLKKNKKGLPI